LELLQEQAVLDFILLILPNAEEAHEFLCPVALVEHGPHLLGQVLHLRVVGVQNLLYASCPFVEQDQRLFERRQSLSVPDKPLNGDGFTLKRLRVKGGFLERYRLGFVAAANYINVEV
jgi:hypothetical protein